jgi:hypothetical protein
VSWRDLTALLAELRVEEESKKALTRPEWRTEQKPKRRRAAPAKSNHPEIPERSRRLEEVPRLVVKPAPVAVPEPEPLPRGEPIEVVLPHLELHLGGYPRPDGTIALLPPDIIPLPPAVAPQPDPLPAPPLLPPDLVPAAPPPARPRLTPELAEIWLAWLERLIAPVEPPPPPVVTAPLPPEPPQANNAVTDIDEGLSPLALTLRGLLVDRATAAEALLKAMIVGRLTRMVRGMREHRHVNRLNVINALLELRDLTTE